MCFTGPRAPATLPAGRTMFWESQGTGMSQLKPCPPLLFAQMETVLSQFLSQSQQLWKCPCLNSFAGHAFQNVAWGITERTGFEPVVQVVTRTSV
jgi:hypothetical protein